MCQGIAAELEGIQLGDQRLNRRSRKLLETLAVNPQASINAACEGWSDTLAAYRFFDHPSVSPARILEPHVAATRTRIRERQTILIVQDTTELDLTSHPPTDAKCLNQPSRFGLYEHVGLAVTPQRLCLGIVPGEFFDREPESLGKTDERTSLPIEQKESLRWLTGYRHACATAEACPHTKIVSVADSEADLYDIFTEHARRSGPKADFLVRARVERCTQERDEAVGPHAYLKVREQVHRSPLMGTRVLELAATPQRAARTAVLEVRAITVTLKPPHARSYLPQVTIQVVSAEEVGGPGDETDVSWLLFTSLPVSSLDDVLLTLDYYSARWTIEVFFRMYKTGCQVEEIRLETLARLKNCLAFYKIIASRVMFLTHLNREAPDLCAMTMFADCEWKSVWMVVKKKPLPKRPPRLGEMMKLLTELGGYNNRKGELPPGPQPIWIGLRRMHDFARAWEAFGPE